jgi:hypothetical protein
VTSCRSQTNYALVVFSSASEVFRVCRC